MTYNFDPDRWLDNELDALELEFKNGRMDAATFEKRKAALLERYDEMVRRLDGTYRVLNQ